MRDRGPTRGISLPVLVVNPGASSVRPMPWIAFPALTHRLPGERASATWRGNQVRLYVRDLHSHVLRNVGRGCQGRVGESLRTHSYMTTIAEYVTHCELLPCFPLPRFAPPRRHKDLGGPHRLESRRSAPTCKGRESSYMPSKHTPEVGAGVKSKH